MKKLIIQTACALALIPSLWSEQEATAEIQNSILPLMIEETLPSEPISFTKPEISIEEPLAALEIRVYQREEVLPLLPLLNTWIARSFSPFPYLYATREDQVVNSGDFVYLNEKNSLVIVAKKGDEIVAIAGGTSLDSYYLNHFYFDPGFSENMKDKGYDPSQYFYSNYFLVAPEYRDDLSVIQPVYDTLADFARSTGKSFLTYMDIFHSNAHPHINTVFPSPEPWGTAITGFDAMDVFREQEWPTYQEDGTVADRTHVLQFYSKPL